MGKSRGHYRGTSTSVVLRRHIESCEHKYTTVEELVDHLRSNYPNYSRQKLHPFTKVVKQAMDLLKSKDDRSREIGLKRTASGSSMDRDDRPSSEEKLERQRIKKRKKVSNQEHGSLSLQSEISSFEEEDGSASTAEYAIVGQKVKPKFDSASKDALESKRKEAMEEKKGKNGPRFSDLGGMEKVVDELKRNVIYPIFNQHQYKDLGVSLQGGILLHGPPGCGKTKLAETIAFESGRPFYKILPTNLVSGISGASEENIRVIFEKAYRTAPSIIFIDEVDVIASKRENLQREMEKRIVTQLMTCMDVSHRTNAEASSSDDDEPPYILVIGATNRPDSIDPALRRPGRFDREIALGVPDEEARLDILKVLTRNCKLKGFVDLTKIARSTPGFVGVDLERLVSNAGHLVIKKFQDRIKTELAHGDCTEKESVNGDCTKKEPADVDWWKVKHPGEEMFITMAEFEEAIKMTQPSLKREGFNDIPNVKWQDVGGMESVRQEFLRSIVRSIKYPDDFKVFNVDLEKGFLLYGPPGCGKTLIAKAVANEAGANFIHIKGPQPLNKYVGESELNIRTLFDRARKCSPCIIFFDEVDALTTRQDQEGSWIVAKLLKQLLVELDGGDDRTGVYVIAATNRPNFIDSALLRSGRIGKHLLVTLPCSDERGSILKALTQNKPIDPSVDLLEIGKDAACNKYSGADLKAVVNEAALAALDEKDRGLNVSTICRRHFDMAFLKVFPTVSEEEIQFYNNWSINQ